MFPVRILAFLVLTLASLTAIAQNTAAPDKAKTPQVPAAQATEPPSQPATKILIPEIRCGCREFAGGVE